MARGKDIKMDTSVEQLRIVMWLQIKVQMQTQIQMTHKDYKQKMGCMKAKLTSREMMILTVSAQVKRKD